MLAVSSGNYNVTEGNESMMVSFGRFWSAEQAFELYAPGVIEAVAGYAVDGSEQPSEFCFLLWMVIDVDLILFGCWNCGLKRM